MCIDEVETIVHQLQERLKGTMTFLFRLLNTCLVLEWNDFDRSKNVANQIIDECADTLELARLNPLYYAWL
jgi:hypothetical protein